MSVFSFETDQQAIQIANDSEFGLASNIWTKDIEYGITLAEQINCGACFINSLIRSDARLPFGGHKNSGYGRELGKQGLEELTNIKTMWIEK